MIKLVARKDSFLSKKGEVWDYEENTGVLSKGSTVSVRMKDVMGFDEWFWMLIDPKTFRFGEDRVMVSSSGIYLNGRKISAQEIGYQIELMRSLKVEVQLVKYKGVIFQVSKLKEIWEYYDAIKDTK